MFVSSSKRVQMTNDNSILSKYSMVKAGYFEDNFIQYFAGKDARRSPNINRGYYLRMKCVDHMLRTFLTSGFHKKQILSLGAGFDTSFFRFNEEGLLNDCRYFEMDFPGVVKAKKEIIHGEPALSCAVGKETSGILPVENLYSDKYVLIGCDLKCRPSVEELLLKCRIDLQCPTFILSEVAICYMDATSSGLLIERLGEIFDAAVFVAYEQVYPNDPFGLIMMHHFDFKMKSPLQTISSFPTPVSQMERYMTKGFTHVQYEDMLSFQLSISKDEREYLQGLEVFDEFEEMDLKCLHYMVICAFKAACLELAPKMLTNSTTNDNLEEDLAKSTKIFVDPDVLMSSVPHDCILRFGHTANILLSGDIIAIGGFGKYHGKHHKRLSRIAVININIGCRCCQDLCESNDEEREGDSWRCKTYDGYIDLGSRMYHTTTLLKDSTLLVFGGRASPFRAFNDIVLIGHDTKNEQFNCYKLETNGIAPSGRWRHSATIFEDGDGEKLLVFGGRTTKEMALNDCYILDIAQKIWKKVDLQGDNVIARHSHKTCLWKDDRIVVSGGLMGNGKALSLVQVIDVKTKSMSTLNIQPPLLTRYSHTAHMVNDHLIMVGGVHQIYTGSNTIAVVDLVSLTSKLFYLPVTIFGTPLMLHNHSSVLLNSNQILVFGGGGTCFSFGTHYNDKILTIDLPQLEIPQLGESTSDQSASKQL